MEMERVETGVDRMMSVLEKKGKLSLTELSQDLKIPESTLQLWVDFLVEERIIGIEYKFTKPYIFLNKKDVSKAVVEEIIGITHFKKEFFEGAKRRKIPLIKIEELWKVHLSEAIEKEKDHFQREAQRLGLRNVPELFQKYKTTLLTS